ncbi:MAG TPA: PEGA domain-containing protein [Methanomicrobiales archaeon]|nr:PEGA domain-containing protein [Methanomicrobiales archaeon]
MKPKFLRLELTGMILLLLLFLAPGIEHSLAQGDTVTPGETGSLIISSHPLGADIFLDGKSIGKATRNIILENVVIGIHDVEWGLPHYENCTQLIDVESGEIATAYCDLRAKLGNIVVISDPPGASIVLDNALRGRTNTTITGVLEGPHTVTVKYPGYYDCVLPVYVGDMATETLQCTLEEIPTTGTIAANSTPRGADVYLDTVNVGKSNVTIRKIEPGTHTVSLVKYGFDDWSVILDVVAAKTYDTNAMLVPTNATLSLLSSPSGAEIFFRGLPIGRTPFQGKFYQGTYVFLFQGPPGYRNLTKEITIPYEGANVSVQFECGAPDAIDLAAKDISDNAPFNPATARVLLQDAKTLLASGKCMDAYYAAVNASDWANDVDHDGVPNYLDIWQSIPNIVVYFSPLVIVLIMLAGIGFHRQVHQLAPKVTIEELPSAGGEEKMIRVSAQLRKPPQFFYCAVLLDGKVIDQLDEPGVKDVTLGRLEPGTYLLQVDLDAYRSRLWRNHIEKSHEITVPPQEGEIPPGVPSG